MKMMIQKMQKAISDPREVVVHFKSRLYYYLLRIRLDADPESLEFYSRLQDYKINMGKAYPRGKGIGQAQIEFGKRIGLSQDETMLDIGCGDLRGGRHFIEYLDSGNYHGMDISGEAIDAAKENLREWGLADKNPILRRNDDLQFTEWINSEFDFVFANSVFTHLPTEDIEQCFANLDDVLSDGGRFCPSFNESNNREIRRTRSVKRSNIYRYRFEELQSIAEQHGFTASRDEYEEHPNDDMKMLVVTRR